MGRYREALTRLFLAGSFPSGVARAEPPRETVAAAPPPRRAPEPVADLFSEPPRAPSPPPPPAPRHTPAAARAPEPPRRAARPRKFRAPQMETPMTHPGRILAQHLQELGLTASDLARDIDVPVNRVTAIINGQRGVTADTALRLGHWFGVDPEDWLDLQLQYELALAREEMGARLKRMPRLVDRIA